MSMNISFNASLAKPPLNQQTLQAPPPFLAKPHYILVFQDPPTLKSDLSVNPQNIEVFHP